MASELENGAFFYLRVLDDKPVALFRLDVNTKTKEVNETIWDGASWQETDRLTMYIAYGSTEVEQVLERDATLAFPDAFRDKAPNFKRIIPSVMSKHLTGKHDQSSHSGKRNVREGTSELPNVLTTDELKGMRSTVNPDFLDPSKASSRHGDEEFSASELMKLPAENSHNLSLLDSESADYLENARQINSGDMNRRVREEGVFQPIILRQWDDGTRSIYDGHHRLIAAYDNHPDFRVPVFVWEERGKLEDEFSSMSKHLAGKHDQSSHGRGGGVGAPRDESRAKQKQAWELHQQGKTWEEVAKEAGYANGGAARLAGKAHEKRMKEKGDGGDTPKIDEKPAKPKTDAEGAQAIADAKAVVDKATGGRPVAEVLAEERAKAGSSKEPTAKELEVTEAVIQSGEILRGEVQRRREAVGKEQIETAKSDLEILKKDQDKVRQYRDKIDQERDASRREISEEVLKSPEMDKAIESRLDSKMAFSSEQIKEYAGANRETVLKDMREYAEVYSSGKMEYQQREEWTKKRAEERFPNNKKAQEEYMSVVGQAVWASQNAERSLAETSPTLQRLKQNDERLAKIQRDVHQEYYDYNRQISDREAIIINGGVTPQQNAEIVRSVLTDSGRTMTDKPLQKIKGTKPVVAELRDELQNIPDELWDSQKYPNLNVTAGKGRGHWSPSESKIKTDGEKGSGRRASTLLHESMHAVEDMNPQITQMQFVMLNRRAKGRAPEKLSKLRKGRGYGKDEVAIEDEWSHPYSGKIYRGGGRRENYEIMTMGIESLYKRRSYPSEIADEDQLNFVMGVLANA